MKKIFLLLILLFNQMTILASNDHGDHDDHEKEEKHEEHKEHKEHNDHGHGTSKAIGKGKAIEEVKDQDGFKLSNEALRSLNIKLESINSSEFKISKQSLVTSKNQKGIYRYRDGFFKFLEIHILKEENGEYLVNCKDLKFGDQIVVSGVGLLRVADVYSTDKSEYGHGH